MDIDVDDRAVPIIPAVRQEFEYLRQKLPFLEYVHDEKMGHQWCLRGVSPRNLDLRIIFYYSKVNGSTLHMAGAPNLNEWFKKNGGQDPGNVTWEVSIGEARLSSFDGVLSAEPALLSIATLMSTQAEDGQESRIPIEQPPTKQVRFVQSSSSDDDYEEDLMDIEDIRHRFD